MVLTKLGEDLLPLVEKAVEDFYAVKKRAGSAGPTLTHMHLLAAGSAQCVLGDAVARSHDIYPAIHYYMHQLPASDILRELTHRQAVLGVSGAPDYHLRRHQEYAKALGLRFLPLYNDQIVLFCRTGGHHDHLENVSFDDLNKYGTICMPLDLVYQGAIRIQSSWAAITNHLAFSDSAALAQFVSENDTLGVTIRSKAARDPLFTSGYFRTINLEDGPNRWVHYLAYLREHNITDEEADLIQQIEAAYERLAT